MGQLLIDRYMEDFGLFSVSSLCLFKNKFSSIRVVTFASNLLCTGGAFCSLRSILYGSLKIVQRSLSFADHVVDM